VGLIPDQGDDHAVEVEEEQDEVEAELGEGFLQVGKKKKKITSVLSMELVRCRTAMPGVAGFVPSCAH
jgi:hypothetical protein